MRISLILAGTVATVVAIFAAWILTADLGQFKLQCERYLSREMGRSIRTTGDLQLSVGREFHLKAERFEVDNMDWAAADFLMCVQGLRLVADTPSLLRRRILM